MSDFSDREYGLGTVRGVRSFDVDEYGRLRGVQYPDVWKPGENTARCHKERPADGWKPTDSLSLYGTWWRNEQTGEQTPTPPMVPAKPEEHSVADCTHGFYAYYDGSNDYRSDARISAVVEGYGDVLIGTRGFRAGKARIVALCIPEERAPETPPVEAKRRWRDTAAAAVAIRSIACGGAAGWAVQGVIDMFTGVPLWLSIPWTAIGAAGAVGAWFIPVQFKPRAPLSPSSASVYMVAINAAVSRLTTAKPLAAPVIAKVRRNYPDVPVFDSFAEMVAAFPTDKGIEPAPETDPEFWERKA